MAFLDGIRKRREQLRQIKKIVKDQERKVYAAGAIVAESVLENEVKAILGKRDKLLALLKKGDYGWEASSLAKALFKFCRDNRKPKVDRFRRAKMGVWIELDRPAALVDHLLKGFADEGDLDFVENEFSAYVEKVREKIKRSVSKIQGMAVGLDKNGK